MKQWLAVLKPHVEDGTKIMLTIFLSLTTVIFVSYALQAVFFPYPLDYGEAPLVDQAMRLAAGQNIYRPDLSSPPYTVSNYPPLYALLLVPFVELFGPSFLAGRAISVLCSLASATFLAGIVGTFSRDRIAALTTGLLFLAIPYVVGWSSLLRVDLLALALSLAALYVVARWPTTRRGLVVSGLLLVAAIYTRQSYALAAPLAAFVWLWTHDWRRAIGLAALVGGVSLLLFLVLQALTRGGFFYNIVAANVNEFDAGRLGHWWHGLRETAPMLLVLGVVFLFLAPRRIGLWPLVIPYLIGAFLSGLTIGKIGSNANYFLELSAALSLVVGIYVAWSHEHSWLRAAVLVILALQAGMLMRATLKDPVEGLKRRLLPAKDPQSTAFRDLNWIVERADGPVLADEFMGIMTLQGKPLYIQPFEVTQLANAGMWDQRPLLESIRNREFPAIFIHHFAGYPVYQERWTPEMLSVITQNYVATDFLADTVVFRPRNVEKDGPANLEACPGAPWRLPTRSEMGMWWTSKQLALMGQGYENTVPVYAVADGLLTRRSGWVDAVAIQHDDRLRPGEKVWSFYGGMAGGGGAESFVVEDFPLGSDGVPVKRGQLLGYQGQWWRGGHPIWVHLHFAVLPAKADGSFPAEMLGLVADEGPVSGETEADQPLDPSPYLGTVGSAVMGRPTWLPLRCQAFE